MDVKILMGRTFYHRNDIRPTLMSMCLSSRRVTCMWLASLPREKNLETGKVEIIFDPEVSFEMSIKEYSHACNVDYSVGYRQIKEAVKDLMGFVLTLDHKLTKKIDPTLPDDWIAPFQIAEKGSGYSKGEGFIRIKFAEELKPLISELSSGFTGQLLESVLSLSESNSSKVYLILREWVSSNKHINSKVITLEDLKIDLGVINSKAYVDFQTFKRAFILPSFKKLEEKTEFSNIKMEIEERRARKAYKVKISWDIDTKELNKKEKETTDFQQRLKATKKSIDVETNEKLKQVNGRFMNKAQCKMLGKNWEDYPD